MLSYNIFCLQTTTRIHTYQQQHFSIISSLSQSRFAPPALARQSHPGPGGLPAELEARSGSSTYLSYVARRYNYVCEKV